MSPRTANKHNTLTDEAASSSSAAICVEDSMQASLNNSPSDAATSDCPVLDGVAITAVDQQPLLETGKSWIEGMSDDVVRSDVHVDDDENVDRISTSSSAADALAGTPASTDVGMADEGLARAELPVVRDEVQMDATNANHGVTEPDSSAPSAGDPSSKATALSGDPSAAADAASLPSLHDTTAISARLKNLVVSVSQVEELSRRAREVAATDLAFYNCIAASRRQFEEGLEEARRIGQEATAAYQRAFGRDAKALAEPAVAEAHDVEQALMELAEAWRNQAQTFLANHPDVETLLTEQQAQVEEARRRDVARAKAERFQQLVTATDAALRQGAAR